MVELQTVPDVFEKLGGIDAVAELTGAGYRAAHNWKAAGAFPPKTYIALTNALERVGCKAPPALWNMVEPARP